MEAVYLALSPLPGWNGEAAELAPGLEIRHLREDETGAAGDAYLDGFWLCHQFESPHTEGSARHRKRREAAGKLMLHATYTIQILAPTAGGGTFTFHRREGDGFVLDGAEQRQPFRHTEWSRRCTVPAPFQADAPVLLERVREVFHLPVLRLQIPIWLLEQGLIAPDPHIRILLCATGLDSLTKSSGQAAFRERLCELLGAETLIFPPDFAGRQPCYQVGQIAGHLYQLRNEMAHGLPFDPRFRKKQGFLDAAGCPAAPELARHRYDRVLEECSAFLLCRALREVLLRRLVFDPHMMQWATAAPEESENPD